jgi:RNA polymerase sigma-70 factor (ECF subfamily)
MAPVVDAITQIKGRYNNAPPKEAIPLIQDFIKSGKWENIEDIQNAEMTPSHIDGPDSPSRLTTFQELADFAGVSVDDIREYYSSGLRGGTLDNVTIDKIQAAEVGYGGKHPEAPRNQRGSADPKHLARVAVIAGGAAAGYGIYENWEGAFGGALAGLLIPGGGSVASRFRQAGAISSEGLVTGPAAARIRKIIGDYTAPEPKVRESVMDNEGMVVERAKAGDQRAFQQIYEHLFKRLVRGMRSYVREAGPKLGMDTEDLVQEALIKAFNAIKDFKGDSSLYTWVYKIAKNHGLNIVEKGKREVDTETMFNPSRGESQPAPLTGQVAREGDNSLVRSDAESAAADLDTPENIAMANEAADILEAAFKKLPPDQARAVNLADLEGMSMEEIAVAMGKPVGTVKSLVSRGRATIEEALAKGYRAQKGPRNQRGEIDQKLLVGGALVGAGAVTGSLLDSDDPFWGAGMGALVTGGLLAGRGKIAAGLDEFGGVVSTRVKNISEVVHHRLITMERRILTGTHERIVKVKPFFQKVQKLKPEFKALLERAILTNDPNVTNNLLKELGDPQLLKDWQAVRSVLDGLRDKLMELRRFKEGITEYFPRIVKDYQGLMKALGQERGDALQNLLTKANEESQRTKGVDLTNIERAIITNNFLAADNLKPGQPGYTKRRSIEDITPELQKYYYSPLESIDSYIRAAVEDIETAKFFGRDLKNVKKGDVEYTHIDKSLGELTDRLRSEGKITPEQVVELKAVLKSRFAGGTKKAGEILQGAKDITNAGLLGNPISAITQFGDSILQAYTQDAGSAIRAVGQVIIGKHRFKMEDFGLTNIAEEFASTTKTARFLQAMFKYGGFSAVDRFGKNVALNAAVLRHQRLAKSASGIAELRRKYGEALGDEFDQLIADLKAGKETDLTQGLAFAELSRTQPITRSELPQAFLDNPRGRVVYMLKSFMLKQVDLARRDGYNEIKTGIKNGDKKAIVRGVRNLVKLGVVLGLAGVTTDRIKKFLIAAVKGDFDPEILTDVDGMDIPMNMLKTFGFSEYVLDRATGGEKGKAQPITAVAGTLVPPYRIFEEIARGDPKAWRYVPIIGPFIAPKPKKEGRSRPGSRRDR